MSSPLDLKNATLLITGGTGSFGNVVLKKYLEIGIGEVRVFSRDEKKQDDMRHHYKDDRVKYYIGDIRDHGSIFSALRGVDYVFHAAALKQVPSCEFYPLEAVRTNVLGTSNLLHAASQLEVQRVVCLSTDKAVYPINAMGISKAMMEKVAVAKARESDATTICVTRYGNVMASRGSVIPLFVDQILARSLQDDCVRLAAQVVGLDVYLARAHRVIGKDVVSRRNIRVCRSGRRIQPH